MNNTYRITMTSPLLRPGITIETEVSERYLKSAVEKLLDIIRDINTPTPPPESIETLLGEHRAMRTTK